MPVEIITADTPPLPKRPIWPSIRRGLANRCPNCGKGRVLKGYLTPVDTCAVCGEELHHQRSDDFAPYLTMVVVGHVVVPLVVVAQFATTVSPFLLLATALPGTAILAGLVLRPIKGAIIGLQWALRMHGFSGEEDPDADPMSVFLPPSGRPHTPRA